MLKVYHLPIFLLFPFLLFSQGAFSQTNPQDPIKMTSEKGITCDHRHNICTSEGNVVMTKGGIQIHANYAKASFEKVNNKMEVHQVELRGNVRFLGAPGEKAFSNYAHYDPLRNVLTLSRQNPKDKLILFKDDQTLQGNKIQFTLEEINGKKVMKSAEAWENVIFKSPKGHVTAEYAHYSPANQVLQAKNNVTLIDKNGIAKGDQLITNFITEKSTLLPHKTDKKGALAFIPAPPSTFKPKKHTLETTTHGKP